MTPEEQRRQDEWYELRSAQEDLHGYQQQINFLQHEYKMGLEKARASEPKLEDLPVGRMLKRTTGWEKTEGQKYEEGPGKNLKEQMAREQQSIDDTWKDLQTNYDIQPNDKDALNRAIAEKKRPLQPAPELSQPVPAPPPSQAAPIPVPPAEPTQPTTAQTPTHHEREGGHYRDMSGYQMEGSSDFGGGMPPPAPQQPDHLKEQGQQPSAPAASPPSLRERFVQPAAGERQTVEDDGKQKQQPSTQTKPTFQQQGQADARAGWQALKQQAAQLKSIEQGIEQMKADITKEQGQPSAASPDSQYRPGSLRARIEHDAQAAHPHEEPEQDHSR